MQGEAAGVARDVFGVLPPGEPVERFTLRNSRGTVVRFMSLGGIVLSIEVADRDGERADVTLGYDTLDGYLGPHPYFGALIGRYANRIARGRFTLDGQEYVLPLNDPPNHLHGGPGGFHTILWTVEPFHDDLGPGAVLRYVSPAGDQGYPGTLRVRVIYRLTEDDELSFDYYATTDRPTPVNLTQHAYFNLAGPASKSILDHELTIQASRFTPVDATLIPTGELRPVAGTPFDFARPARIGERIGQSDAQLLMAGGYDHNFVLDRREVGMAPAARLRDPGTSRVLEIRTTEPGLQFYSGNHLGGGAEKQGRTCVPHGGLALETQHFPDSPNRPGFPSTILRPGEAYVSRTALRFSVDGTS